MSLTAESEELFRDYYRANDAREWVGLSLRDRLTAIEAAVDRRTREALMPRIADAFHDWGADDDPFGERAHCDGCRSMARFVLRLDQP
jgi:hypothetical protein